MNTDSQPAATTPDADQNNVVMDSFGRPLTRWAMHFDYWAGFFATLSMCIVALIFQKVIKATPPDDPLHKLLFLFLTGFFILTVPSLLISLVFPTPKQPQKPVNYHSKRFIFWLILYGLFVIPLLIHSVNSFLSPVPPSNWPFNLLSNLLPAPTPTWNAFWQSIALNPLAIICIGFPNIYMITQTYRDQMKAMAMQKKRMDDTDALIHA